MSATRPAALAAALAALLAGALGAAGLVVSAVALASARASPAPAARALDPVPVVVPAAPVAAGRDGERTTRERRPARAPDRRATRPVRPVRPVGLTIRAVGFSAPVRPVGATADGTMALPPDPRVLGWYRFGPAVARGARGSAVVAGHLDSRRYGLGPLVRLREARPGDRVRVVGSDGRTRAFVVRSVERYDRQSLPARLFARRGPLRLRVITCGGDYDADRGGYQQNLVVTATPA